MPVGKNLTVLFLSVWYWLFFLVSLPLIFVPYALLWVVTTPTDARRRVFAHMMTTYWGLFYIWANPIWSVRVSGNGKLPWHKPVVIVSNHESMVDILVLFALRRPFRWVSKASNFKLPVIGWVMRMSRYIPVVRGDRRSVVEMMKLCEQSLKDGMPVLFFPEGTRSKDGRLQPFKDGAFALAMRAGVPVYPVALTGTGDTLPKHGLRLRNRMEARVEVLDPLYPERFDSVERLREAARSAIAEALSGMRSRQAS